MVYARMSICRWRSFEEYKLWTAFSFCDALVEYIFVIPLFQYFLVYFRQVEFSTFCKFFCHLYFVLSYFLSTAFLIFMTNTGLHIVQACTFVLSVPAFVLIQVLCCRCTVPCRSSGISVCRVLCLLH